jgi:glycosyltransferase involved in cell wall biosynthesis
LLPRAVESALGAGTGVEVIVVDDASTDGTARVCAQLQGIKYIRLDRNQGVAGARNIGLLESSADFIAFLDDDDLRLPGSLDHQLSLFEGSWPVVCCLEIRNVSQREKRLSYMLSAAIFSGRFSS